MCNVKRYAPEGFPKRLKDLWLLSGMTQRQLAERIGYERKAVNAWINGDYTPNITALIKLCGVFNVSADYLLFGKENKI